MNAKAKTDGHSASFKAPQGSMFLYEKPEFLSLEDHGNLGWTTPARPFEFAQSIMSVPLVTGEIAAAQMHYPVVFSSDKNAVPLAVLSVIKGQNMFVDANGNWEANCYVPSYLRCHPFTVARGEGDQFAVVIDRASAGITESPESPFFLGDQLTEKTQAIVNFCGDFETERTRTRDFTKRLTDLGLLKEWHATHPGEDGEPSAFASFFAVDMEKFGALEANDLQSLHKSGFLSLIYAHLFSLENWNRLRARSNAATNTTDGI